MIPRRTVSRRPRSSHVGLSTDLLEYPHDMATSFSQIKSPKAECEEATISDLRSHILLFLSILLVPWVNFILCGKEDTKERIAEGGGH